MTNINLNNFFVVGDYLTFIDSANSNDTYNAYITSISTDGALIIINKQISGVNTADYLVSRNLNHSVFGVKILVILHLMLILQIILLV